MKTFVILLSLLAATGSAAPMLSSLEVGHMNDRSSPVVMRNFVRLEEVPVQEEDIPEVDDKVKRNFVRLEEEPVQEEDIPEVDG